LRKEEDWFLPDERSDREPDLVPTSSLVTTLVTLRELTAKRIVFAELAPLPGIAANGKARSMSSEYYNLPGCQRSAQPRSVAH